MHFIRLAGKITEPDKEEGDMNGMSYLTRGIPLIAFAENVDLEFIKGTWDL